MLVPAPHRRAPDFPAAVPGLKSCLSIAWNEPCQPLLSAEIRNACSSCSRECPGKYRRASTSAHADSLWTVSNFYNVIARSNFSFLQHAKVESRSVMFNKKRRHSRLIHADADAVARYAWLRYFKFSTADAISIADADLVIRKSLNGEVFSELTEGKIVTAQKALPVVIGIHLVDKNGALLPTMTGEIALRITIDIELAHHSPSLNRTLPDRGTDSLTVPCHVAWKTDIY